MADKIVPVEYLDQKAFWEMVKKCDSYRVRKDAGHEPKMENWEYTWKELQMEKDVVIARQGDLPFLESRDLNEYMRTNFEQIRRFAKRGSPLSDVRYTIAKIAADEKIMAQLVEKKDVYIDDVKIEKAIDRHVQRNKMGEDMDLSGIEIKGFSEFREVLYERYKKTDSKFINTLRKMMKGEIPASEGSVSAVSILGKAAISSAQIEIQKGLKKAEVYEWMEKKSFKGNVEEARFAISIERLKDKISKLYDANKIVISKTLE